MKLNIFKSKPNIFFIISTSFLTIIVLFLFIDSNHRKIPNVDKITAECRDNHHYHAAVAWNETPIIGKLFKKELPALRSFNDCFKSWSTLSRIVSDKISERERKIQTATIQLSFMSPDDDALECEPKYKYYSALWWNNAPLLGTFFKKTLPTYDVEFSDVEFNDFDFSCFKLESLIFDESIEEIKAVAEMLESMNEMEQRNRQDFGYEYLRDYGDQHKDAYKIY
ncbi:MAG: hypothetical protein K0U39_03470 [Alphaproteobacteria bacterium]|nr:hypothetical protein [Alphaproteobacteria bacterium]